LSQICVFYYYILFSPRMFSFKECTSHCQLNRTEFINGKGKGLPQQSEVAQGVLGRLRPQIFLTFGTTRVVGLQPTLPQARIPTRIREKQYMFGRKCCLYSALHVMCDWVKDLTVLMHQGLN